MPGVLQELLDVADTVETPPAWLEMLDEQDYLKRQGVACYSMQAFLQRRMHPYDPLLSNHLCAIHDQQARMIRNVEVTFDETPRESYYVGRLSHEGLNLNTILILTYLRGWDRYNLLCSNKDIFTAYLWGPFQGHAWANACLVAEAFAHREPETGKKLLHADWKFAVGVEEEVMREIWKRNGVI